MTIIEKRCVFDTTLLDKKGEENQRPDEDYSDGAKLIRDLQKAEGNPQCFGKANGLCEREDCAWRAYCLKES
jgi:hypothetical protein